MFFNMPPPVTEEYAERMGYDAEFSGANTTNCHFSIFATPQLMRAWERGSYAAPGFMKPEGVVVFHTAGNVCFKRTLEKDEMPKALAALQAA